MSLNRETRRRARTFTPIEITRIIETARRYGANRRGAPDRRQLLVTLFTLLCHYGPRISEALMLQWEDVEFEQGEITLRTLKKKKPTWRTLPLLPVLTKELLALRAINGSQGVVFPSMNRRIAGNIFRTILHKAGLPYTRMHDLRHSFLSTLLERTRDPVLGRDLVGHGSIQVTDKYYHSIRMREKFQEMGSVYDPPTDKSARLADFTAAPPPPSPTYSPPSTAPSEPQPARSAAPWGLPWLPGVPLGGGNTVTGGMGNGAARPDADVQARMDRIEGAFVLLMRGLAEHLPLQVENRREALRERRQPLPLGPGDDAPPTAEAEGDAPDATKEAPPGLASEEAEQEEAGGDGPVLTVAECAKRLKLDARTFHSYLQRGTGPPVRRLSPCKTIILESDFEAWLESRREEPKVFSHTEAIRELVGPLGIISPGQFTDSRGLYENLKPYGLDSPTKLAKVLGPGRSRQQAQQILSGKNRFGMKVAKRIAAATGVPFTLVLQWQYNSIAAAEAAAEAAAKAQASYRPEGLLALEPPAGV